jgi:hypothetical protein
MAYSGAWGKLIHEKKPEGRKSRDTVSLKVPKFEIFYLFDFKDFLCHKVSIGRGL